MFLNLRFYHTLYMGSTPKTTKFFTVFPMVCWKLQKISTKKVDNLGGNFFVRENNTEFFRDNPGFLL